MQDRFQRMIPLIKESAVNALSSRRVVVFGAGGVGGYVIEGLARMGVGRIEVVDGDVIDITNVNRQVLATEATIGRRKTDVAAERIRSINPGAVANGIFAFYLPENADDIDLSEYDYVVDAIDTVTAKIELAVRCNNLGVPIISVMGTGNKCDPMRFTVSDIAKTKECPLCRVMRRELKERNVPKLKVVWSDEPVTVTARPPATVAYVPAVAAMLAVKAVTDDLIK